MKKNLLFIIHGLGIGGIETCLVNLINALPPEKFNIDLLVEYPLYRVKDRIRANVSFVEESKYIMDPLESYRAIKKHGGFAHNISWSLRYFIFRVLIKAGARKKWKVFESLPKHYDVAIAYSQEGYGPYYVIDKVSADKKVLWYHAGVYEYPEQRYKLDLEYYPRFDNIVCVSEDNKKVFSSYFKETSSKILVLSNLCDPVFIKTKAKEFYPDSYKGAINIVTVGRMVEQKKPDVAVNVCKKLVEMGHKIKWHWVGDGEDRESIVAMIEENHLGDVFILEGNQTNPYPYFYNADIYAQTSRHEAFCTTITEAKILCKPVVTTDVCGVRYQIENGKNGLITEQSVDDLANAIDTLIRDPDLRKAFEEELKRDAGGQDSSLDQYMKTIFS